MGGGLASAVVAVVISVVPGVAAQQPFPTTLPTATTSLSYGWSHYTGTLPTEIGLLTNMVGPMVSEGSRPFSISIHPCSRSHLGRPYFLPP